MWLHSARFQTQHLTQTTHSDSTPTDHQLHVTGEAEAFLPAPNNNGKPITVIGTEAIRASFDQPTLQEALNSRSCPGVTDVVINPDAHVGYGALIGCVMASPTHIYPGSVGVDIKCSMSLLQFDIPRDELIDKKLRRALIDAICARTPTRAKRMIEVQFGYRFAQYQSRASARPWLTLWVGS